MSVFALLMGKSWEDNLSKTAIKLGRTSGAQGLPTADTSPYDQGETEVRNQVQRKLLDLQQTLSKELQRIVPDITKRNEELSEVSHQFQSRQPVSAIGETLEAAMENKRLELTDAFFRRQQAEGAYNKFRLDNNINILPDHPTDRLNYLSVVFVILAVETAINSPLWGLKLGENFVVGILEAAGISALNIAMGLAAGMLLSYKNLNDSRSKILGWLGCATLLLGCAFLNWYAISARQQAGADGAAVSASPTGSPDFFSDTNNLLMFAIAMTFAVIATYKGYRLFGSIPGYEVASKTFLTANAMMVGVVTDAQTKITTTCSEQVSVRNGLVRRVADVQNHMSRVDATLKQLAASYAIAVQQLNTTFQAVVGLYRQNNLATKASNTPSPSYFSDKVERYGTSTETLVEAIESAGSVAARATEVASGLQSVSQEEVSLIQSIKANYLGERLTKWKDKCTEDGRTRFLGSLKNIGNQGQIEALQ